MTDSPAPAPSNWNVPNALTTLRILMVPFFGWALLVDGVTIVHVPDGAPTPQVGDPVEAVVVATEGIDLVAEPR